MFSESAITAVLFYLMFGVMYESASRIFFEPSETEDWKDTAMDIVNSVATVVSWPYIVFSIILEIYLRDEPEAK